MIIWDDDHYYMGGVLAELCRAKGLEVTLVTPAAMVSAWTVNTLEALPIAKRIARLGIDVRALYQRRRVSAASKVSWSAD